MKGLLFDWDLKKDKANVRKHGVSFDDAQAAFYDETAVVFHDPDHSDDEDRIILLGLSLRKGVLVVCHCVRENDTVIRIISARCADKEEERDYWEIRK
ncbi:MAG: BrnT family toxin [Rhodothermales bacterium]|nr:BrnT family toxin [Rhodothermales bacterium]